MVGIKSLFNFSWTWIIFCANVEVKSRVIVTYVKNIPFKVGDMNSWLINTFFNTRAIVMPSCGTTWFKNLNQYVVSQPYTIAPYTLIQNERYHECFATFGAVSPFFSASRTEVAALVCSKFCEMESLSMQRLDAVTMFVRSGCASKHPEYLLLRAKRACFGNAVIGKDKESTEWLETIQAKMIEATHLMISMSE